MTTTHHVKMAKASQSDIDAAIELYQFLEATQDDRRAAEVVDEFGYTGYGDLLESSADNFQFVLRAHERGGLFRVVWGMQVLLDPKNEVVDPNLPHLELHPKHEQAARELEALCKAKNDAIDERDAAIKAREEYRAVVARQIEDKRRLLAERDEARQHHENALAIAAHNFERVKQLDAENKAQFETLDALRGLHDQLLAAVMGATAEFREWQECEADAIEGQEAEVEHDHNRMLAALHALRRKAEHVQSGTRAVVEAGSLPAHLERAEQPKPVAWPHLPEVDRPDSEVQP